MENRTGTLPQATAREPGQPTAPRLPAEQQSTETTGVSRMFWQYAYEIIKEIIAGAANGVINGIIVAAVVLLLGQPPVLAIILGVAMVINLVVAGIFGAVIKGTSDA